MKVLFLHPNQPSQFKQPALELAKDPANEVVFLSRKNLDIVTPGVKVIGFKEKPPHDGKPHLFMRKLDEGCRRATAVASVCARLKQQGFTPDVIVAHSGWGDGMYLRTIYPDTPQLHYMEFFFRPSGADLGFDPTTKKPPNLLATRIMDNAIHLLNFQQADWCITPTYWQKSVHPVEMHAKMSVLHEGVDTAVCAPKPWSDYKLPDGRVLDPAKDEIITHVERHFDLYRGFPTFLKAIEIIQQRRPHAHVLVVGKQGRNYSSPKHDSFAGMIGSAGFDRGRTHFLGHLNYANYIKLLQVSSAHIYLTYPFVLSWSFMEAMAVGCPIACSDSAPVKEMAEHGKHCRMFDFFDPEALADSVDALLDDRDEARKLGMAARQKMVEQYDARELSRMSVQLIRDIAGGVTPQQAATAIQGWNHRWGRDDPHWQASIPLYQV